MCTHTKQTYSPNRINAVLKSHMEHHQSSGLSGAEGKCPADLMPIKKISLPSVNGLLSSFPFFHFLIISLLSLQKKFSTALKSLQVLFILPLFSPQFYFFPASLRGFLVWVFFPFFFLFLLKQLIYCSPTCWERLTCYWASSDSPCYESLGTESKQRARLKGVSFLMLFTLLGNSDGMCWFYVAWYTLWVRVPASWNGAGQREKTSPPPPFFPPPTASYFFQIWMKFECTCFLYSFSHAVLLVNFCSSAFTEFQAVFCFF